MQDLEKQKDTTIDAGAANTTQVTIPTPANLTRFASKEQAIVVLSPDDNNSKGTIIVKAFKHMIQQIRELPSAFWLVYGALVLMEGKCNAMA